MKKTLKILLTILLLIAVSFGISGCKKDEEEETKSKKDKGNTEVVNTTKNDNDFDDEDEEDDDANVSSVGTWNGNVYKNEFLGIKFTMPSSWTKTSDSELMAQDSSTGDNVIVQFEDLPTGADAELIYDNLKDQLESLTDMEYDVGSLETERFCGKTFKTVKATVSYLGIDMVQKYYMLVRGNKAGYIIITVTDASRLDSVLSNFSMY